MLGSGVPIPSWAAHEQGVNPIALGHTCLGNVRWPTRISDFRTVAFEGNISEPKQRVRSYGGTHCRYCTFNCQGYTFQGHTFRYGGLHASHRNRRTSLLHIPDSAVVVGRAPGAGARGSRRRVGAIDIQQRMPNLPYDQGRRQSPGPKLKQHHGRKAGSLPSFGDPSAMKGADFVWDKEKLDSFIAKPDEVVPGNNMKPYGGLASAEDRTKLIAFLQSPTPD